MERNKEEDERRFLAHKIQFNFSIVVRIKEAMVGLASRCVVMALEVSPHAFELTATANKCRSSWSSKTMCNVLGNPD